MGFTIARTGPVRKSTAVRLTTSNLGYVQFFKRITDLTRLPTISSVFLRRNSFQTIREFY